MRIFTYRFQILKEPSPTDLRPFAPIKDCLHVMKNAFNEPLDDKNLSLLKHGEWAEHTLSSDDVATFHQMRRKFKCCSRIKWQEVS